VDDQPFPLCEELSFFSKDLLEGGQGPPPPFPRRDVENRTLPSSSPPVGAKVSPPYLRRSGKVKFFFLFLFPLF